MGRSSVRINRLDPMVNIKPRSISMISKPQFTITYQSSTNNIEDLDMELGDISANNQNEFEMHIANRINRDELDQDDGETIMDEEMTSSNIQRIDTPNTTLRRARSSFIKRQNSFFKGFEEVFIFFVVFKYFNF